MSASRRCPYCQDLFLPSAYRPKQSVCSKPTCQRHRRTDYHRKKLAADPLYRQSVRESQRQWWEEHPEYQKQHRQKNPQQVENNRKCQRQRDQRRRLDNLVRNNLAVDLKHSVSEIWLLGPKLGNLDRNILASTQVLIFLPLDLKARGARLGLTGTSL